MSSPIPCYFIESLRDLNPTVLWASFFINPAIALMNWYSKPFPCTVVYEHIVSETLKPASGEAQVEFDWSAETFPDCARLLHTLQRESIVEYAAIAAAFLVMTNLVGTGIAEVTMRGDKADYFVDGRKYLLEVSGTESAEHLGSRHGEKIRQLQANTLGKDGYVFVCCFANQRARLSFHRRPA